MSVATRIHDGNDKTLRIFSSLNLYILVGQLSELLILLLRKQLAVPAILRRYIKWRGASTQGQVRWN